MIKTLEFQNFRCFPSLEVDGLAPVTIIGGKNSAGKTAVLEAIYFLIGFRQYDTLSALTALRSERGVVQATRHKIFAPLFYRCNTQNICSLTRKDADGQETNLQLTRGDFSEVDIKQFSNPENILIGINQEEHSYPLKFKFTGKSGTYSGKYMFLKETFAIHVDDVEAPVKVDDLIRAVYYHSDFAAKMPIAELLSQLLLRMGKDIFINILLLFDDGIRDILTVSEQGILTTYVVREDGENMPLSYMGVGINKAIQILVMIESLHGGILLIDDIESGFHYSIYEKIIEILFMEALRVNCQVIVTSQSIEFIQAASRVLRKSQDKLAYIRMGLNRQKEKQAFSFSGNELQIALESNMEIR